MKRTSLILIYFFLSFITASLYSCKKDDAVIRDPGFKVDSSRFCNFGLPANGASGTFIRFDSPTYKPTPNTWYKTDNNWWYRTGSDVNVVQAGVSFTVLPTPYAKSCQ